MCLDTGMQDEARDLAVITEMVMTYSKFCLLLAYRQVCGGQISYKLVWDSQQYWWGTQHIDPFPAMVWWFLT